MKLFVRPWKLAGGFLLGGLLVLTGLILQMTLGPVRWDALAFPANIVILAVVVAGIAAGYSLRKRVAFAAWLGSPVAAVAALGWTLALTVVMGLTAQIPERGWLGSMVTFWPFVLSYGFLTVVLGMVCANHIWRLRRGLREIPAVLNHLGLFVTLTCATLGSADKVSALMTLNEGEAQSVAVKEDGTRIETGLSVHLNDFIMETYPSGMPKRFASDVVVTGKSGNRVEAVIDVNKPLEVEGWKMYQYDYDSQAGPQSTVSVLELVRDPWLPFVYAGIFMMLAGALTLIFTGGKKEEEK